MSEHFTYSPDATVYRRKTLSTAQKLLVYSIIFLGIVGTGVLTWYSQSASTDSTLFIIVLIAPTLITFVSLILIALNPKGPEANFILPGADLDPLDASTISGQVRFPSGELREVTVTVPNVHSTSTLSVLTDSAATPMSDGLAFEEMCELALETVQLKHPGCQWETLPTLSPTS